MPIAHIVAPPIAPLIGAEKIEVILIHHNHRISCGTVLTPFGEVGYGTIAIIYIDGIAIRAWLACGREVQ